MLEVLTSIPAYKPEIFGSITEEEYNNMVAGLRKEVNRAIELFEAYWKTSNIALFNMSLEALKKAYTYSEELANHISNTEVIVKLSKRATFTFDLAAIMCMLKLEI